MSSVRAMLARYNRAAPHRLWTAFGMASLICVIGWVVTGAIPDRYQSTALLYIDTNTLLAAGSNERDPGRSPPDHTESVLRMLLRKPFLDEGVAPTEGDRPATRLATGLTVTQHTGHLFHISYRDRNPVLARNVVQTLLTAFVGSRGGADRADNDTGRRLLMQQIQSYEQQLRAAEKRRADFRHRYEDLLPYNLDAVRADPDSARRVVATLDGALHDAQERRRVVHEELDKTAPTRSVEGEASQPPVANPDHARLQSQLLTIDTEVWSLMRRSEEARADLERVETLGRTRPDLLTEYRNLDRDYRVLRWNYEEVMGHLQAPRIIREPDFVQPPGPQIIDRPEIPRVPVAPNRPLLAVCVLFAGLTAGAGLAIAWPARNGSASRMAG